MAKPKIRPGTKHPTKPGLVMGYNGRYVAKSTYNRQKNNQIRATKKQTKAPTQGGPIVKSQSSAITKPPSAKPTSQRVERVNVRVEPQRQLSGSGSRGALSPGQQRQLPQGKTRPQGRASAKRAQAAAKAARAAQGTRGTEVRIGETGGAANQRYGQRVVNRAVNRAVTRTQLAKFARRGGLAGLGMAAAQVAASNLPGQAGRNVRASFKDQEQRRKDALRLGKDAAQGRGLTKPARRGMSNLGSNYKAEEARLAAAATASRNKPGNKKDAKPATKPETKATKPATKPASEPATKPSTKPETKATPKATPTTSTTKTTKTTSSKKRKLTAREKMLNRKAERLRKQAAKRTSSARDRFFARKARTYK